MGAGSAVNGTRLGLSAIGGALGKADDRGFINGAQSSSRYLETKMNKLLHRSSLISICLK